MTEAIRPEYRLYIDEVGNADLKAAENNENHRYLSLTGLVINLEYVRLTVFPRLEALKATYFDSHPDNPMVLHRHELVNKKPPFTALRDPSVEAAFNHDLLAIVEELDFTAITAVIDKKEHLDRYRSWANHPYHYCLEVLLERYAFDLRDRRARGDVMAEARGAKEDQALKAAFASLYASGTGQVAGDFLRARLTSRELKLKRKVDNIAGLQLADLLAHPSWKCCQARRVGTALAVNYGGSLAAILEARKYRRSPGGKIDGYGRKWLP